MSFFALTLTACGQTITLAPDNLVLMRGEINGPMIAKVTMELATKESPILFIQSPGGEVMAGMQLIQWMKDSGKTFTCITDIGASMAFAIFQACDKRYVMPNSVLMQHQASFSAEGPYEKVKTFVDFMLSSIDALEAPQAKRIGLSLEKFKKKIVNDWFIFGEQNIKANTADAIAAVRCDQALTAGKTTQIVPVLFFQVEVVYSNCPLIRSPLSAEMKGGDRGGPHSTEEARLEFEKFVNQLNSVQEAIKTAKSHMWK